MEPEKVQRRGVKRKKSEDEEHIKEESDDSKLQTTFEDIKDEEEVKVEYIEEIDNLCRLCAKSETEMIQIFNEDGELNAHCIKLMPNIQLNDGLPQMACFNCLEKLQSCANIIDGFVANQQLFFN